MSEKVRVKGVKTMAPPPVNRQGKYRWSFEYASGDVMDKYNVDGTKNVYSGRENKKARVFVPLDNVVTAGLTDADGNLATVMDVPVGAVVFQRRRVMDINYFNRFHDAEVVTPEGVYGGRWYPESKRMKRFPEYTYSEVWFIGWRLREADDSISLRFKVVYPDGVVEEYTEWGVKPWLGELEWLPDEILDEADGLAQAERIAKQKNKNYAVLLEVYRDLLGVNATNNATNEQV